MRTLTSTSRHYISTCLFHITRCQRWPACIPGEWWYVSTVRLALCHFFLCMFASRDTLLLSPGSPATSTGLQ